MNDKRILKNIGVSMLMKPVSMALSFIYTPIILNFLGEAKNGVWVTILQIVSAINYFDIGIGNGLRNKLAESHALGKHDESKKYVSNAYIGTLFISAIFGVLIIGIWNLLDLGTFFNMTATDSSSNFAVSVSVFFICLNFVLSLSKTSAYAIQKPGIISVADVCNQILQITIAFTVSKLMDGNLVVTAIVYGAVTLVSNTALYFFLTSKRDYLRPSFKLYDKKYMKPLLTVGAGFFIIQMSTLVLNTTDNLIISKLLGSENVTSYNMPYKLFQVIVQVHAIIIMPMWSAYTEAATYKNMAWIKKTMKRINLLTLLFSAGAIVLIFIFEPLAAIWLRKELVYDKTAIMIIAIYVIVQMFSNNYSSFVCGVGRLIESTIICAVGAIANIPLSIYFAKTLGMGQAGIILGSLSVMSLSIIILPFVARNWIKKKEIEWKSEEAK